MITIEPGIYLEDEALGIRLEDDVLVAGDRPQVLSESIPVTADAIEERMAR